MLPRRTDQNRKISKVPVVPTLVHPLVLWVFVLDSKDPMRVDIKTADLFTNAPSVSRVIMERTIVPKKLRKNINAN